MKIEWFAVVIISVLLIAMIHMTPEQLKALVKLYELARS
jgi:ABC-type transporter Mla MlaB component